MPLNRAFFQKVRKFLFNDFVVFIRAGDRDIATLDHVE